MSTGFHGARRSARVVCAAAEHASSRMPNGRRDFPFMKTSYPAPALDQEAGDLGGHVVERVEQLVIGVENLQSGVGVAGGEFARGRDGDGVVVQAVENQRGLVEIREIFVAAGIRQK